MVCGLYDCLRCVHLWLRLTNNYRSALIGTHLATLHAAAEAVFGDYPASSLASARLSTAWRKRPTSSTNLAMSEFAGGGMNQETKPAAMAAKLPTPVIISSTAMRRPSQVTG